MDCPSEENLIRMKLDGISSIANLDFDIPNRKLTVFHSGQIDQIEKSVLELNLGGKKISTEQTDQTEFKENTDQKKLLWTVVGINFAFFLIEMTTGIISNSMGLVADSIDMLADSFVYGISLLAVGRTITKKKTDCQTCWIFSNNTCDYWICRSFKEIFRRRETSRFFNNDYRFNFCTYCKRSLSLHFTNVKK